MTDTFDRTTMLSGLRSYTTNTQKELGDNETLRGIELIQQMLDLMPTSLRTKFNNRLELSLETGTVHDFRVMLQTLFANDDADAASPFMLAAGTSIVPATDDNTQLTPAHAEVLDALNGLSDKQVFWWAHRVRDSKLLSGEQDKAFVALMTAFLSGDLQVDSMGRPLAEQQLDGVTRERDDLEREVNDLTRDNTELQRQLREAKNKLTAAKDAQTENTTLKAQIDTLRTENNRLKATAPAPAPTPVVTGSSDELLKVVVAGVNHVGTALGFNVPSTVRTNNEAGVQTYLDGDFKTRVTTAVKTLNDKAATATTAKADVDRKLNANVAAAREANRLLGALTVESESKLFGKAKNPAIIGRGPVQRELAKIDPSIIPSPTVPLNPVS